MQKEILDFPNYLVDDKGNIFSKKSNKYLKPQPFKSGYMSVDLCNNGTIKKLLVHRIIANAFIPNPENKEQVNHINGNKADNRVENLEWNTRSENQKHSIKIGLRTAKGIKNSQCKLNEDNVLNILNDKRIYKEIAKDYNISVSTIADIKRGYSWSHITKLNKIR